jgi:hypothetical protein
MGVLIRNPVDAVESPRVERHEMQALDPNGVTALLNAAQGSELQYLHPRCNRHGLAPRRTPRAALERHAGPTGYD